MPPGPASPSRLAERPVASPALRRLGLADPGGGGPDPRPGREQTATVLWQVKQASQDAYLGAMHLRLAASRRSASWQGAQGMLLRQARTELAPS
jgi:hypothetical protein